jgi:hypothetical protein
MRPRDRAFFGKLRIVQCFLALTALCAAFAGCRQVLSIEQREYDPSLADAGTDADAQVDTLSCEYYCQLITDTCKGSNKQYSTIEACIGLCSTFPEGKLDDEKGNTLGCRIHVLETTKAMIESSDCAAAGPGGDGVCGSNCESFCSSMQTVCPQGFESEDDCMDVCTPLIECGNYHVTSSTPDNPSIQCRLYHMSAAAINILSAEKGELTDSQLNHCPHAMGETECIVVADPMCP